MYILRGIGLVLVIVTAYGIEECLIYIKMHLIEACLHNLHIVNNKSEIDTTLT